MPRKTVQSARQVLLRELASMRPRPDAAENDSWTLGHGVDALWLQ